MMLIGILYGLFLVSIIACCQVAAESDELMEEMMRDKMAYLEAEKRLEAYQIKK